jgi:hypothetical protein
VLLPLFANVHGKLFRIAVFLLFEIQDYAMKLLKMRRLTHLLTPPQPQKITRTAAADNDTDCAGVDCVHGIAVYLGLYE